MESVPLLLELLPVEFLLRDIVQNEEESLEDLRQDFWQWRDLGE
jgi:hypothetical protein